MHSIVNGILFFLFYPMRLNNTLIQPFFMQSRFIKKNSYMILYLVFTSDNSFFFINHLDRDGQGKSDTTGGARDQSTRGTNVPCFVFFLFPSPI
jgi:hypothetical protein